MKRILTFSRLFLPAMIFSSVLIISGIAGYKFKGGFNMGIDFRAGLIQEVQLASRAFSISYDGPGNAVVSLSNTSLTIAVSGAGVQGFTYQYLLSDYGTIGAFAYALNQVEGISVTSAAPGSSSFSQLVLDAQSAPVLPPSTAEEDQTYWVHYLPSGAAPVPLEEVRSALSVFGEPAIQVLGDPAERHFMVRLQDSDIKEDFTTADIGKALEGRFGEGEAAITSSNYVGSRFSKNLANQAIWLLGATLLLILIYASVRFKPQYAVGAVLGIIHDGLIMVGFIVWTGMEFNTTTIAAIMTILGYSINDTIVIFDRIRETVKIYPDDDFKTVLNRAITETLSRTFITTLTTMLAVISLYVFTTGSMKDFALALLVGLVSGVYSTIFIASGFVYFWERKFAGKTEET
ncbi:MAG: protein translocase subunit SecF [Spirochaetaceae bacterium]|jgi:preprotein translocase subunit SecF|nr:protein translocase subunit SecF [Spirochaetaceae bacterium]